MRTLLRSCLVLVPLIACTTGRDFVKPTPESLVLGKVTRAEIQNIYGTPYRQNAGVISTSEGNANVPRGPFDPALTTGSFPHLTYLYADKTSTFLVGAPPTQKLIGFDFWNDTLVGYNFLSNFKTDTSNFDDSRVGNLVKGVTSKDDVVRMLGAPTGRGVYPIVQTVGDEKYLFTYVEVSRSERLVKNLEMLFGSDGVLHDYRFVSDTAPLPAQPASNSVPIFIPSGKK
jgi:hypothetical protein